MVGLLSLIWPLFVASWACNGSSAAVMDAGDAAFGDAVQPPDITTSDSSPSGNIGSSCDTKSGKGCTGQASCLKLAEGLGVCTISGCTMEDLSTATREDTCPEVKAPDDSGALTSTVCTRIPSAGKNYCFPACKASPKSNPCTRFHSNLTCDPVSIMYNDHSEVCLFPACKSNQDCDSNLLSPHTTCHLASGTCLVVGKSGVKVGSPCKVSPDCGPGQFCYQERKNTSGKTVAEGGYCTVVGCSYGDPWLCPAGSQCFTMGASNALSLCLAVGCKADAPQATDGCRDETSAGQYDCVYLGKQQVCWLANTSVK